MMINLLIMNQQYQYGFFVLCWPNDNFETQYNTINNIAGVV